MLKITDKVESLCIRECLCCQTTSISLLTFLCLFSLQYLNFPKSKTCLILGKFPVGPTDKPTGQFPEKEAGIKAGGKHHRRLCACPYNPQLRWVVCSSPQLPGDREVCSKGRKDKATLSSCSSISQLGSAGLSLCFSF